ncbi:hypothetical protein CNQ36_10940 [Streptomyces fungicidicus]|uniref:Uncharacterized protein n=1 Tax=Streptomyces fungicidicus TaxID=68203 RepID=A0A494UZ38_9ACTN|nr:hypothetical protein CNQ36_10940 [Streptomyces fungicidicus]
MRRGLAVPTALPRGEVVAAGLGGLGVGLVRRQGGDGRRLHGRAAAGAGQGAVEVPSARLAKVHDAGRLGSVQVRFLALVVKVWRRPMLNGFETAETVMRETH